jgi:hypothetical protein
MGKPVNEEPISDIFADLDPHVDDDLFGINVFDLNREYTELVPRLARYTAIYSTRVAGALKAKAAYKRAKAFALLEVSNRVKGMNKKVAEVDALMRTDLNVTAAHDEYAEAERLKVKAKGLVDSLLAKRDMLQSLGAKLRVEMQGDLSLRESMQVHSGMTFGKE